MSPAQWEWLGRVHCRTTNVRIYGQLRSLGERCKLLQRGPGQSPGLKPILTQLRFSKRNILDGFKPKICYKNQRSLLFYFIQFFQKASCFHLSNRKFIQQMHKQLCYAIYTNRRPNKSTASQQCRDVARVLVLQIYHKSKWWKLGLWQYDCNCVRSFFNWWYMQCGVCVFVFWMWFKPKICYKKSPPYAILFYLLLSLWSS